MDKEYRSVEEIVRDGEDMPPKVKRQRHRMPLGGLAAGLGIADAINHATHLCEQPGAANVRHSGKRSRARPEIVKKPKKIGRNAACPCGSGAKFKKCCGAS